VTISNEQKLLLLCLLFFFPLVANKDEGPQGQTEAEAEQTKSRYPEKCFDATSVTAKSIAIEFIKDHLLAPSTAEFPSFIRNSESYKTYETGIGCEWIVASHVDAENKYGAKIRARWNAYVEPVSKEQWKLNNFYLLKDVRR
jgi:hypothetical protein